MGMLFDTREGNEQGFEPKVDNQIAPITVTGGQKFAYICCFIFTLGLFGIWHYKRRNWLNEQQIEVNTAASNIDIALTKRRDTLIKLLEQQKAYYKYEGNTQTNIAKLRSMDIKNFSEAKQVMDNVENEIKMTFENYPDLKANQLAQDLMGTSELLESEIAASRRVYNMKVEAFNSVIYTFPTNCIAKAMGLKNFALFQATSEQKQDVDMSSLSDYDSNSSNPSNDQNNDNKLTNNY